jgi:hypothetical protein
LATGFAKQDLNCVIPLERLAERVSSGIIEIALDQSAPDRSIDATMQALAAISEMGAVVDLQFESRCGALFVSGPLCCRPPLSPSQFPG